MPSPSLPGSQAATTALDWSTAETPDESLKMSGRPEKTTTTKGSFEALASAMAAKSAVDKVGVALSPVPSAYGVSPTTNTATSLPSAPLQSVDEVTVAPDSTFLTAANAVVPVV